MFTDLSISDQLKSIQAFSKLTENPASFEAIYDLDEVLRKIDLSAFSITHLKSQPEVAAIIAERYLAPMPNLAELLTYPFASLGYQFAHHLVQNQFDPAFYRKREVTDDISYVSLRRSQTHDIHHVVTGFGTDLAGELGLQAFQLAQMHSPIAIAILTAGLLNVLDNSSRLQAYVNQMIRGWELGLQARPLIAQKWEEQWEKPLAEWQTELGLAVTPLASQFVAVAA